eukprot:gene3373-2496_t
MATLQESSEEVHDLNVGRDYCRNRNPAEAFSELIANAITADSRSRPIIVHDSVAKKVSIKDCGSGLLKKHFIMGKSQSQGHSNHGIGLKDAIAILAREYGASITIRSRTFRYTFKYSMGSLEDETLHLVVLGGLENFAGTQIDIEYTASDPTAVNADIAKAKQSFLDLFKDTLSLVATDDDLEMYVPRNSAEKPRTFDYIFVAGAKKGTARQFQCIYNVKGSLAEAVKDMVDRDHNISKKKQFNRDIYPRIQQFALDTVRAKPDYRHLGASQMYEFQRSSMSNASPRSDPIPSRTASAAVGVAVAVAAPQRLTAHPPPAQVAPRPSEGSIVVDPQFHRSLARQVFASLDEQNSPMITLSPGERLRVLNASNDVKNGLQHVPGLSVSRIGNSGSIAKNTAVPHSVDVDMVVFLNDFEPSKVKDYARAIKSALASRECRFLSSADDILECVYGSINIDIVLTSAAETRNPRYREFQEGPEAVTYLKEIIGDNNAWVAEVVRAAKFWVMRCNDCDHLRVKSLAVELVVLEVFKASHTTGANRKDLFRDVLRFLTRPLTEQRIPHLPEKAVVFAEIKEPLQRYKLLAEAALRDLI